MKPDAKISFLTEGENMCLAYLNMAQEIFDEQCEASPQSPSDSYNFGHYVDAARNAVLIRGARRLDPALMKRPGDSV